MNRNQHAFHLGVRAVVITWAVCCGCTKPKQVEITHFDVPSVCTEAMQQLDANQDGKLSSTELKESPGLRSSRKEIDQDRDGHISASELAARLQTYVDQRIAVLPYPIHVTWRGSPLIGATVELTPETFLADMIQPASGQTDSYGVVRPSIELDADIADRGTSGFRSGVYRVTVSKKDDSGKEQLPAKYNTDSELGLEVSMREHMKPLRLDL